MCCINFFTSSTALEPFNLFSFISFPLCTWHYLFNEKAVFNAYVFVKIIPGFNFFKKSFIGILVSYFEFHGSELVNETKIKHQVPCRIIRVKLSFKIAVEQDTFWLRKRVHLTFTHIHKITQITLQAQCNKNTLFFPMVLRVI